MDLYFPRDLVLFVDIGVITAPRARNDYALAPVSCSSFALDGRFVFQSISSAGEGV